MKLFLLFVSLLMPSSALAFCGGAGGPTWSMTAMKGEPKTNPQLGRREAILSTGAALAALVATSNPRQAPAFGPSKVLLQKPTYREVVCPPKTQVPGQKAGAGLRPVCIVVSVDAENISKEPLQDAGVFGFVYDEQGESVVANNPDGNTDAGQFAIIPSIPPGKNRVEFQFVAAIDPKVALSDKKLTFESLKAISYPGGKRFGEITECEMNPLADGCDMDEDYKRRSK